MKLQRCSASSLFLTHHRWDISNSLVVQATVPGIFTLDPSQVFDPIVQRITIDMLDDVLETETVLESIPDLSVVINVDSSVNWGVHLQKTGILSFYP